MTDRRSAAAGTALGPFVNGLVAAVALASLISTSAGASTSGVAVLAIGMGFAAAVFAVAGAWLGTIAGWFYSLLGVVAFIPAAVDFVRSNGCLTGPPPVLRFSGVALLVAVAGTLFVASLLTARRVPASSAGLAAFGGLQILIAAATFIVGWGSSSNLAALAVMVPGAAGLGWFVVRASETVLAVAGVAFGMQSVYASAIDPACGSANFGGVVLLVVFTGAYFATRAVCAPFAGRR